MSTKNAANEPEVNEAVQDMGLSVIGRRDTGVAVLPSMTDFELIISSDEDGAPFGLNLDENTGVAEFTMNQAGIINQMCLGKLKIKDGKRAGEVITRKTIDDHIEKMKALLLKDDLFADGVADEYKDVRNVASKINSPFEAFKDDKKTPFNQMGDVVRGVPAAALGEFVPLRRKVLDKLRAHGIKVETMEREATAADNLLREKTADEIPRIAYLVLDCRDKSADEVKIISAELLATKFTPHSDQADRYNEARSQATEALAAMYGDKVLAESAAALKEEQDAKEAADKEAELLELRAGVAEQELKDYAGKYLADIQAEFVKCAEAPLKNIVEAIDIAGVIDQQAMVVGNPYYDRESVNIIFEKMEGMRNNAKQKEEAAAAAVKAEADRVAKEASDKKEKEDREKAEVAAALEKANQELLLGAEFVFDGAFYSKQGCDETCSHDWARLSQSSEVIKFIISTTAKIAANKVAAKKAKEAEEARIKKAEEARIKKEEAAKKKAAADKEAARKSYSLKVEEMTAEVKKCKGPDEMIFALLGDKIPHVRFSTEY